MDELYQRLDRAEKQLISIKNKTAQKDLLKMIRTIDAAMVAADMESVECRRLKRETARHRDLVKKAEDLIVNLEQHLTFAMLLSG
jgi:hypothetical protein